MTNKLYAKPILENRFWILESDGKKVGTICKQEDRRYMFSCESGTRIFDTVTAQNKVLQVTGCGEQVYLHQAQLNQRKMMCMITQANLFLTIWYSM